MKIIFVIALLLPALSAAPSDKHPQLLDEGRIVGGVDADIRDYPYTVSLQFAGSSHSCGGSILTRDKVYTAAHCVDFTSTRFIRAGSSIFSNGGQLIQVASSVQHPQYSRTTLDYDAAVMTLVSPLEFNEAVQPIPLARIHSMPSVGATIVVIGWGSTSENGPVSTHLQKVEKPIVSNEDCARAYQQFGFPVTDSMICAGFPEGGRDACQGDSGGPLVYQGYLAGGVSWGVGCARAGFPGVYSKVAHMWDWLDFQIRAV